MNLKIYFQDCWERDTLIPEEQRWMAFMNSLPGMVVTAPTKELAFEEIMTVYGFTRPMNQELNYKH